MKNFLQHFTFPHLVTALTGLCIAWYMPYNISMTYPIVGRDAKYFLSRLVDTHLFYRVNGLAIQWYTPTFGGGLPAYPHPLNAQFSLPQLLAFFTDPWTAMLLSYAAYILVGYLAAYAFFRRSLAMNWQASTLGAGLFSANGFYLEHIANGHLNFQAFPLLPVFLFVLLDPKISDLAAAAILGLTAAVIIYSASTYPAVFIILSLLMCLPLAYLVRPGAFRWAHIAKASAFGILLSLGLTLSKLYAVASFMGFFPRDMADQYNVPLLTAFQGLALQLAGVMSIAPVFALQGIKMGTMLQLLQGYTGGYIGLWELDLSVSPVLWILLAGGCVALVGKTITQRLAVLPRQKRFWLALVLLLLAMELALEFTFARGWIYPHLRTLPFLKALHINPRFGSAFIMPLVLLGTVIFSRWTSSWTRKQTLTVFLPLNLLVLLSLTAYLLIPTKTMQRRDLDVSSLMAAYKGIENGETFPIEKIADVTDQRTFDQHASNLKPYEVLFGYAEQTFHPTVVAGPVREIRGGAFNMTNPTSLVYPAVNGNPATFSRIPLSQQAQLEAFIAHHDPGWNIPIMQQIWNIVALGTLVVEAVIFALLFVRMLKARNRARIPGSFSTPEG